MREILIPSVVPIVLILNKDRGWRMCTYSRDINRITIRYKFILLRMDDLKDCFSGAKYFSKVI